MKWLLPAVLAALLPLAGCVDDEPEPVTIVMVMANGRESGALAYTMGGHEPDQVNHRFGGISATRILAPGDFELQTARLHAGSVGKYVWFFQLGTQGEKATFAYTGCAGTWILEARVVDDGDSHRLFTDERCE